MKKLQLTILNIEINIELDFYKELLSLANDPENTHLWFAVDCDGHLHVYDKEPRVNGNIPFLEWYADESIFIYLDNIEYERTIVENWRDSMIKLSCEDILKQLG